LADRRSPDHEQANGIRSRLTAERRSLYTTNFIAAETHALVLNRLSSDLASRVLRSIDASTTTYIRVSWGDEQRAREIIRTYDDKDFTLTDATSFAVMERLRIGSAFTFDHHFAQYGFAVLGLEEP
jgi:predicted nucleic acid-binding protein